MIKLLLVVEWVDPRIEAESPKWPNDQVSLGECVVNGVHQTELAQRWCPRLARYVHA